MMLFTRSAIFFAQNPNTHLHEFFPNIPTDVAVPEWSHLFITCIFRCTISPFIPKVSHLLHDAINHLARGRLGPLFVHFNMKMGQHLCHIWRAMHIQPLQALIKWLQQGFRLVMSTGFLDVRCPKIRPFQTGMDWLWPNDWNPLVTI